MSVPPRSDPMVPSDNNGLARMRGEVIERLGHTLQTRQVERCSADGISALTGSLSCLKKVFMLQTCIDS